LRQAADAARDDFAALQDDLQFLMMQVARLQKQMWRAAPWAWSAAQHSRSLWLWRSSRRRHSGDSLPIMQLDLTDEEDA